VTRPFGLVVVCFSFSVVRCCTLENENQKPIAVITGGAQGIGARTAEVLAERGYRIALLDRQACDATTEVLARHTTPVLTFLGDVTDDAFVTNAAAAIAKQWGTPDVIVNNAGISFIRPAEETSVADFRRVVEVNLVGPFVVAHAFAPAMLAARRGSIVNIASIAGIAGVAERSAYNASKHGLVGLTRTLAAEWGSRGVRCNAVCPGWVKTPMDDVEQARGVYQDKDITDRVPMGRFASPDDIARAVAFLADPTQSGFINGHTLVVDGGWTADASWESLRLSQRSR
jgi:NAD(P)-dependent dehydrogenase (short-subunit alcohol dehydrogenase family)